MADYTGRTYDLQELYRQLDSTRDQEMRRSLERTISMIKGETQLIRSMREALLRAHRNSDIDEIKDIHDYIANKERYGSNRHI